MKKFEVAYSCRLSENDVLITLNTTANVIADSEEDAVDRLWWRQAERGRWAIKILGVKPVSFTGCKGNPKADDEIHRG